MCRSCEVLCINGLNCHETGCPDAWRDAASECKECGAVFTPTFHGQQCCDASCFSAYTGLPFDSESNEQCADDDDRSYGPRAAFRGRRTR